MPPVSDTGRIFMEKTKYRYLTTSDQEKHLPQPPLEVPPDLEKPVFDLPKPETIDVPPLDLRTAIEERHSVRVYEKEPLTLPDLGFLLWCTQGVKKVAGTYATFRTVPSAGARHALETYLLINDVEGLEPGLSTVTSRSLTVSSSSTLTRRSISVSRKPVSNSNLSCGAGWSSSGSPYPTG
jgi:hypothetical protein